jgi:EpsI family protein
VMSAKLTHASRFGLVVVILLIGGLLVNAWTYLGEASVTRTALSEFPVQLGEWQRVGGDQRFDVQTESVLRADDYLMRNYRYTDGRIASLYVGYYATQRNGASYHSPLNCLPGAGWVLDQPGRVTIVPRAGGLPFQANRYVIEKGRDKQLMVYWYEGRGRALASEYWGKVYTVLDSVRRRRSDGAIVRILIPVGASESAALEAAVDLAANTAPVLTAFVPK